jgi:hypothetical protein
MDGLKSTRYPDLVGNESMNIHFSSYLIIFHPHYPPVIKHDNGTSIIYVPDVPISPPVTFGDFPASHVGKHQRVYPLISCYYPMIIPC